jgi:hypothetical protein
MQIEQIYTGCLAQGYLHTFKWEGCIIDPLETQPYLERLERDNVKLKYILKPIFMLILFRVTLI